MEHFSLLQPAPLVQAPWGLRLLLVRVENKDGAWLAEHDVLKVVGIQPILAHHYAKETVAPVHPTADLMDKHGWRFEHLEMRYAPLYIDSEGKLATAVPDDPAWRLIEPDTPDDRVESLAQTLKTREVERRALERQIEEQEEGVEED
jgi:hypothetical protein